MIRYVLALCAVTCLYGQTPQRPEDAFADIFAAVLTGENPDGGQWGNAASYIDAAARRSNPSEDEARRILSRNIAQYRILIVPGFLSACAPSARAFMEAEQHLRETHGLDVQFIQVPDDTSKNNGSIIASYIRQHADGRKYIVVGHSKGAPDLQEALLDANAAADVAAFVSVAGAVTGSPLAEASMEKGLAGLDVSLGCAGKLVSALESLSGNERRAFLREHPVPVVPSYSIVARASRPHTSQVLVAPWVLLGAGSLGDEDGLLMASQGICPAKVSGNDARRSRGRGSQLSGNSAGKAVYEKPVSSNNAARGAGAICGEDLKPSQMAAR